MADYITTRQYADMHGIPLETVRTWTKAKKIPFIKVGDSIMIDRSTPTPKKRKPGRKSKDELKEIEEIEEICSKTYKVKITRAYYISIEDGRGKEVASDFTFLTKADAEKIGAKMKKEVEGNNGNR